MLTVVLRTLLLVVGASAMAPHTLSAAVHICPTPEGAPIFQDRPCEAPEAAAVEKQSRRKGPPVGIHESWMDRPETEDIKARCNESGCVCDGMRRSFDSGLPLAVADALYLDGAWHRHDEAVAARTEADRKGETLEQLDRDVEEASCDVLMSQRILHAHAADILITLRRRARDAEDRGFEDGSACDEGRAEACDFYEAVMLYQRMNADLALLRTARESTLLSVAD